MQSSTSLAPFLPLVLALVFTMAMSLRTRRRSSLFSIDGWDPRIFSSDLASRPQGDRTGIVLRELPGISGLVGCFRAVTSTFGSGLGSIRNFLTSFVTPAIAIGLCLLALCLATAPGVALAAEPARNHSILFAAVGSLASQLKEAEDKIAAKSKKMHEVFKAGGEENDFGRKEVLELTGTKDANAAVEWVRAANDELTDLGKERDKIVSLKKIQDDNDARMKTPRNQIPQPGGGNGGDPAPRKFKTLGEIVVGSDAFQEARKSIHLSREEKKTLARQNVSSLEDGFGVAEMKATFLTSSGWAPESLRVPGLVVEKATRPIQVLDIIPAGPTDMAVVKYMEETTRTHAGAERSENASYAESSFVLTERSETVRSIGESVPVTDEQLEDVAGAQMYLEQRLMFGCRQRLDGQIIIGDGNAPNLTGIKNKAGINTQAKGTDPIPDAVYKAMRVIRVTGRAFPNAVVFHPTDWEKVRLLRTADGIYIWGSPSEVGPERIWGAQVVQCDADSAGSAYAGDYANFCALYERRGIEVAIGYVSNDFLQGRRTIRAGLRVAFAIYRAAAFTQITGL